MRTIAEYGIIPFGLVVVNLYSFEKNQSIENIDVGGPSMIRAAAKNWESVTPVTDTNDYALIIHELKTGQGLSEHTRFSLAAKAFRLTANYDGMIALYYERCLVSGTRPELGAKH